MWGVSMHGHISTIDNPIPLRHHREASCASHFDRRPRAPLLRASWASGCSRRSWSRATRPPCRRDPTCTSSSTTCRFPSWRPSRSFCAPLSCSRSERAFDLASSVLLPVPPSSCSRAPSSLRFRATSCLPSSPFSRLSMASRPSSATRHGSTPSLGWAPSPASCPSSPVRCSGPR